MELWSTNETVDVRVLWLFESFQDYKLRLANYRPDWVCCLSVYSQLAEHGAHGYVYWNFLAVQWLRLCLLVQDMRLAEELRSHQAPGQNIKTENRNNIVTQFSKYFWKICACLHAKSLQSCLTLWDSLDCSLSRSSVQRSDQGRILKWVANSFSGGSSWPRDQTRWILHHWATWKVHEKRYHFLYPGILSFPCKSIWQ